MTATRGCSAFDHAGLPFTKSGDLVLEKEVGMHLATIFAGFSGFRFQAETDESKMPVSAGFTFWFRFQSGFPGVETVETI